MRRARDQNNNNSNIYSNNNNSYSNCNTSNSYNNNNGGQQLLSWVRCHRWPRNRPTAAATPSARLLPLPPPLALSAPFPWLHISISRHINKFKRRRHLHKMFTSWRKLSPKVDVGVLGCLLLKFSQTIGARSAGAGQDLQALQPEMADLQINKWDTHTNTQQIQIQIALLEYRV